MTNLLIAIKNIAKNPITELITYYQGSNRANNMGDALETYIKDLFCDSLLLKDNQQKDKIYSTFFSYLGNTSNPPDIIIKNGDAIEVKKIENLTSALALNSSYPKNKLHSNDSRITADCRNCEGHKWEQKDIIYTIGVSQKNTRKIQSLWFVYGDCYAAEREIYTRIADKISQGINEIPDVEFIKTNELAKVKKVDPLGITDLRVRGMWHIDNPIKVFKDYVQINGTFSMHALMREEKYFSFPEPDRKSIESMQDENFTIRDIEIKSPNNPAQLLKAKFISYVQ